MAILGVKFEYICRRYYTIRMYGDLVLSISTSTRIFSILVRKNIKAEVWLRFHV